MSFSTQSGNSCKVFRMRLAPSVLIGFWLNCFKNEICIHVKNKCVRKYVIPKHYNFDSTMICPITAYNYTYLGGGFHRTWSQ